MKEFSPRQLAEYNGENGKPAYIAYQGDVFDVSKSRLWKTGLHMHRHHAGGDLTVDIEAAPHTEKVLENYPRIGRLKKEDSQETKIPTPLVWLLRTNPFFRRHPHPMTVHFPIVFLLANPFFNLLYLATGQKSFETTAFHCLVGGILFMVVAMLTGLLTWQYNYMAKMLKPVAIKITLSVIMLGFAIVVFIWRIQDPYVLDDLQGLRILYLLLVIAFIPFVSVIGWYGANMTFPLEKK